MSRVSRLLLFILAAWLFLGSVARSVAVDGVLVEPGETSAEGNRSVQAFVWVESGIAPQIEAGMPAAIELAMTTDREAVTLAGEVAAISAVPLSEGLADFESMSAHSVYRLDVALDEGPASASFSEQGMPSLHRARTPVADRAVPETGSREMRPGASSTASDAGSSERPKQQGSHAHRAADARGRMRCRVPRQRSCPLRTLGAADRAGAKGAR